jgi:sensor domain CHASE-containing protein
MKHRTLSFIALTLSLTLSNTHQSHARGNLLTSKATTEEVGAFNTGIRTFAKNALMHLEPDMTNKRAETLANKLIQSVSTLSAMMLFLPETKITTIRYLPADTEKKHPIKVYEVPKVESAPYLATFVHLFTKDVVIAGIDWNAELVDRYIESVKALPLGPKPWEAK